MKYALVIFETDESRDRIQADRDTHRAAYESWIGRIAAAGKLIGGDALDTEQVAAVTVRKTADAAPTVTGGPAHPGEETLGGWFVIDVADREEAVELAKALRTSETVEIRPLLESA
ncbi:YciI family protein [Streptomyces sp. NPDC053720]|uniref:YciI family protein n=1 Tax=Streptomyces sp. NPDC053720 TaxID=3154855 RepID=UPI003431277C